MFALFPLFSYKYTVLYEWKNEMREYLAVYRVQLGGRRQYGVQHYVELWNVSGMKRKTWTNKVNRGGAQTTLFEITSKKSGRSRYMINFEKSREQHVSSGGRTNINSIRMLHSWEVVTFISFVEVEHLCSIRNFPSFVVLIVIEVVNAKLKSPVTYL